MGIRGSHIALGAVATCLLLPGGAAAAEFNVTSQADVIDNAPGDGNCVTAPPIACTLRAAIMEANSGSARDIINVPAGTYTLGIGSPPGTDDGGTSDDLDILQPVEIRGAGARSVTISGNRQYGVFHILQAAAGTTISGVTITRGVRTFTTPAPGGGGVTNMAEGTTLVDSAVTDNEATNSQTLGSGIYNRTATGAGRPIGLRLERVLVADHTTSQPGGAAFYNEGRAEVVNSTLSGNEARLVNAAGGAAIRNAHDVNGYLSVTSSTFRENLVTSSNLDIAADIHHTPALNGQVPSLTRSILGDSPACNPNASFTTTETIELANSCGLTGHGDRINTDPQLGALADNGGPTNTHLPARTSPAVDGTFTGLCPLVDQRGIARPFPVGGVCDVGAVELVYDVPQPPPPAEPTPSSLTLTPTTARRTPGDANVIIAVATRTDGSPVPFAPLRYAIAGPNAQQRGVFVNGGEARISWDGVRDGRDTVTAFVDTNGDGAASAGEPTATATVDWVLPPPEIRKSVNIEPVSGKVLVKLPAGAKVNKRDAWAVAAQNRFIPLEEAKNVPVGTVVNSIRGRVELAAAARLGTTRTNTGQFYSGQFQIVQSSGRQPYTELRMNEGLICAKSRRSSKVTAARARSRQLWGNGKGRFRTRGRNSSATVRGTIWYSKDDCKKTTTVVREGTVVVNDFGKKKNVTLRAGDRYVARSPTSNRNK